MLTKTAKPGSDAYDIPYIMGWDRSVDSRQPVVLQGDPKEFQQHGLMCPYTTPHWAGMLCFEERLSPDSATAIYDLFSGAVLPGARTGQFSQLGVLHREPGRVLGRYRSAIHFMISHVDLLNDRRVQPSWKSDRPRLELFQELLNLSWGFASPKDPARARAVTVTTQPRTAPRVAQAQAIAAAVRQLDEAALRDPALVTSVVRAHGALAIEIDTTRSGRMGIQFKCPASDEGTMEVRMIVDPDRLVRQLARSSIRALIGERYERTPALFERLREAFLVELELGRRRHERRHGFSEQAYTEMVDWTLLSKLAMPQVEASPSVVIKDESSFGICSLPNPMAGIPPEIFDVPHRVGPQFQAKRRALGVGPREGCRDGFNNT